VNWLRDLVKYRNLLAMLVWRDITIKYKQSVLGLVWAILMPTVIVMAGVVVKLAFAMISNQPLARSDIASVAVKAVPWAFFVAALRFSTNSLTTNANLVTKVYFPRVILPLAAVLSQFFDLLVASVVLIVLLACLGVSASATVLWAPPLIAVLVLFAAGVGIFLAAASLFFRDVKYLVDIFLTFAIFFTPVFYDVALFREWGDLLLINPVGPILEAVRSVGVDHQLPDFKWVAYSTLVAFGTFAAALAFFRKVEPAFAECI
jgi:lipopolysaccharide transport system permease protein